MPTELPFLHSNGVFLLRTGVGIGFYVWDKSETFSKTSLVGKTKGFESDSPQSQNFEYWKRMKMRPCERSYQGVAETVGYFIAISSILVVSPPIVSFLTILW